MVLTSHAVQENLVGSSGNCTISPKLQYTQVGFCESISFVNLPRSLCMVDDGAYNKQLQATLDLMQASLEAIADAVVWVNPDRQIDWCNAGFEQLMQRSRHTLIGSQLGDVLPLTRLGQPITPLDYPDEQLRQGGYSTCDYDIQLGDRTLILEISGSVASGVNSAAIAILIIRDITQVQRLRSEHQQRAIALEQAEAKYKAIFENATQGIYQSTPEGKFFSTNPAFANITGYSSPQELIHTLTNIEQQFYADPQRRKEVLAILHEQGFISNLESQILRKDGSVIWISESSRVVCDEAGQPLYYEGFVEDITERKQAEDEREELLSILRATLESTSEGILVVNQERNVPVFNQKFQQMWGVPGALMLPGRGDDRLQFLAEQTTDADEFKSGVWDLFLNHPQEEAFDLVEMKDGRVFERYSQPQWIGDKIVGRVWGFRDITERKHIEEALQQQAAAMQASIDGIAILDHRQTFVYLNESHAKIHGYPSTQSLIGKSWKTLYDEAEVQRFEQVILPEFFRRGQWRGEAIGIRRDGSRFPQDVSLSAIHGGGMVCVVRDVTARKRAEAALQESETELRALFGAMDDVILVFDRTGRCLKVAPTKTDRFFRLPDENLHKTVHEVLPKEQADLQLHYIHQAIDTQQTIAVEYSLVLADGEHWFDASVAPLSDTTAIWVARDITDRKRLEQELLQSQQFLDNIIDNIPLAVFVKDVANDFRYVLINKISEAILGFPKDGAIGLSDYDLLPLEQANYYRQQDTSVVLQKTTIEFPEQCADPHGEDGSILVRGWKLPLFDTQGNVSHLVAIVEDVTERRRQEQALRLIFEGTASKTGVEFFRTCIRYLTEVLQVRYALVTEIVDEARTRARTLADWGDIITNENQEYLLRDTPTEQVLLGEVFYCPEGIRTRFPHDDHLNTIEAESYLGVPLINSTGNIVGHLAVMDTKVMAFDPGREMILKIFAARAAAELERKQAEDALEQRAQVDNLLSNISRQFIDQDANTAINYALEAIACLIDAERSCIFEFSDDQHHVYLVNEWCAPGVKPLSVHARSSTVDVYPDLFNHTIQGNALQMPSIASLPPNAAERQLFERESIQSAAVVPMILRGKVVGFIGVDVTTKIQTWSQQEINLVRLVGELIAIGRARHKAEEALRVAKDAAEAANRAKSIFLANMSHELRTPLNAILGFSQLMERDTALTPRQREFLTTINRSGEHLLDLINDVLEMSKIEAGRITLNPAPFDLHHLLRTIDEMFQIRAQAKQLSLQLELSPTLPQYVITDEGKLRQVLINLLGNAMKFTQQGTVILRVREQLQEHGPIHTLCVEVEDTGRGIAADEVNDLFQPFVQTMSGAQAKEGTGLGLTISRQFVQLMGGDIHVNSTLGQGSTFYFDVQITLADEVVAEPSLSLGRVIGLAPDQPSYRILVVDDRQENRDLIAQLLEMVGFEVRTANDGQEAIALWQQWQPRLIWMDIRMPNMDGYEATRYIRAAEAQRTGTLRPSTRIIALTASAFEEQRATILAAGCDDFVRKPFKEHAIFAKMAEHLDVQYIYQSQDDTTLAAAKSALPPIVLTSSDLRVMSRQWIAALHQATIAGDSDQMLELIQQIPEDYHELARRLEYLVDRFCYDEILHLTQSNNHSTL
jgi:two-component system, sensor histidine kinase and response regulator